MAVSWLARLRNPVERLRISWNVLVAFLIFTTPTHFFVVLNHQAGYVSGLRIDYLLPKLYLSVFFALGCILWWLYWFKPWKTWGWPLLIQYRWQVVLLGSLAIAQYIAPRPDVSLWFLAQLVVLVFAAILMVQHRTLLYPRLWIGALGFSVVFQTSVALWQWLQQKPLIGYALFGEPSNFSLPGIATTSGGAEWILPYATTAHPNVLGGYLAIASLSLLLFWSKTARERGYWRAILWILIVIGLAGILLTQSSAAILSFSLGGLAWVMSHFRGTYRLIVTGKGVIATIILCAVLTPLIIAQFGNQLDPSWYRRDYLNRAAVQMIQSSPITGIGLNHFTVELENVAELREFVRFVQPAHNGVLLWLAETGVLGVFTLITITWLGRNARLSPVVWGVLPLVALDHYLLTMPLGILLVAQLLVSQRLADR